MPKGKDLLNNHSVFQSLNQFNSRSSHSRNKRNSLVSLPKERLNGLKTIRGLDKKRQDRFAYGIHEELISDKGFDPSSDEYFRL